MLNITVYTYSEKYNLTHYYVNKSLDCEYQYINDKLDVLISNGSFYIRYDSNFITGDNNIKSISHNVNSFVSVNNDYIIFNILLPIHLDCNLHIEIKDI